MEKVIKGTLFCFN